MIINPAVEIIEHIFNQEPIENLGSIPNFSMEQLRKESSFSRKLLSEARDLAGPCTQEILDLIEPTLKLDRKYILIDVQIQFLKKNQYTTNLEGTSWHIDGATSIHPVLSEFIGIPAFAGVRGALDIDDSLTRERKMRFTSVFIGDSSKTEYLMQSSFKLKCEKCIPSFQYLDKLIDNDNTSILTQEEGSIYRFGDSVLHRGASCKKDGWRYWLRLGEIDFYPRARQQHIDTVYE